jgi:hypothetical protein
MFAKATNRIGLPPHRTVEVENAVPQSQRRLPAGLRRASAVDGVGNQAGLHALDTAAWCGGGLPDSGPWLLTYDGYDRATEGIRETLCTLANGYWGTRAADPSAHADGVHHPGTYVAGVYNRMDTDRHRLGARRSTGRPADRMATIAISRCTRRR